MISSRKIGAAFARGMEVATGSIMQNADGTYSLQERVQNEAKALADIRGIAEFHASHPNAPDTANPDEVLAVLMAAYEMGKASGLTMPVPTVPGTVPPALVSEAG
jgi:hypothetical protein